MKAIIKYRQEEIVNAKPSYRVASYWDRIWQSYSIVVKKSEVEKTIDKILKKRKTAIFPTSPLKSEILDVRHI